MRTVGEIALSISTTSTLEATQTEIAEHKGFGHPDSLCDGAEGLKTSSMPMSLPAFPKVATRYSRMDCSTSDVAEADGNSVTGPQTISRAGRRTLPPPNRGWLMPPINSALSRLKC